MKTSSILLLAATAFVAGLSTAPQAQAKDQIPVRLDEAVLVKLPERVATLIIGNPMIADAALQPGGLMVLTGKSYGDTNLIALDRQGQVLMERTLRVRGPADALVLYRGVRRETYSCSPNCEARIVPGDTSIHFDPALTQPASRSAQAEGATPSSGIMMDSSGNAAGRTGGMNINIQMGGGGPSGN